jgi:hypothetical protein
LLRRRVSVLRHRPHSFPWLAGLSASHADAGEKTIGGCFWDACTHITSIHMCSIIKAISIMCNPVLYMQAPYGQHPSNPGAWPCHAEKSPLHCAWRLWGPKVGDMLGPDREPPPSLMGVCACPPVTRENAYMPYKSTSRCLVRPRVGFSCSAAQLWQRLTIHHVGLSVCKNRLDSVVEPSICWDSR